MENSCIAPFCPLRSETLVRMQRVTLVVSLIGAALVVIGLLAHYRVIPISYSDPWKIAGSATLGLSLVSFAVLTCMRCTKKGHTVIGSGWIVKKGYYQSTQMGKKKENEIPDYARDFINDEIAQHLKKSEGEEMAFATSPLEGLAESSNSYKWRSEILNFPPLFENTISDHLANLTRSSDQIEVTFLTSGLLFGEFVIFIKFIYKLYEDRSRKWQGDIIFNLIDSSYKSFKNPESPERKAIETFEREVEQNLTYGITSIIRVFDDYQDYIRHFQADEKNRADCLVAIEPGHAVNFFHFWSRNALKKFGFAARIDQKSKDTITVEVKKRRVLENAEGNCLVFEKRVLTDYQNREEGKKVVFFLNFEEVTDAPAEFQKFIENGENEESLLNSNNIFLKGPFKDIKYQP